MPDYESGDQGSNPCSTTTWYNSCMALFSTKKVTIPTPEATTSLVAAETWSVRWQRPDAVSYGAGYYGTTPKAEFFFNEGDAKEFWRSLLKAASLLKMEPGNLDATVQKEQ
jgi:hypothetical protein